MSVLEELIAPMPLDEFRAQVLYRQPFSMPSAAARFREFLSWDVLDEIFKAGHRDCWLPREGRLPPSGAGSTGTLTLDEARAGLAAGRTVLVRHSELSSPRLNALARDFGSVFPDDPVDIQLYYTPAGGEGFNWHYDAEDVFVIQSTGEKEFVLRQNTINPRPKLATMPKDLAFERENAKTQLRILLKAGDWLYIPAGWWHKAKAVGGESRHLSVGVLSPAAREP